MYPKSILTFHQNNTITYIENVKKNIIKTRNLSVTCAACGVFENFQISNIYYNNSFIFFGWKFSTIESH